MTEQDHEAVTRYKTYQEYLMMKVKERDWHGVADCAMDLRELEAKFPFLAEDKK